MLNYNVVFFVAPILVYLLVVRKKWRMVHIGFIAYMGAVAAVTLFPIPFDTRAFEGEDPGSRWERNSFIPFVSTADTVERAVEYGWYWTIPRLLGGNLVLLAPLGFLAPLLWPSVRGWKRAAAVGLLGSLTIELLQLGIGFLIGYPYRFFDVDDLILNTVGCVAGYLLIRATYPWAAVFVGGKKERGV